MTRRASGNLNGTREDVRKNTSLFYFVNPTSLLQEIKNAVRLSVKGGRRLFALRTCEKLEMR